MDDLHVLIVQPNVKWKDAEGNLARYTDMLSHTEQTDLILLPEMFQTGFCTDPEDLAENMGGPTLRWMKRTAETHNCAIAGSLIIRENRRYFNRLIFIDQYENLTWYDKRHLFSIGNEDKTFTAGKSRLIVPLKGWQINFQICYDLRFPVWSRSRNDYEVLINVANWPAVRKDVWNTLLKARAIENQSFVIGVNRTGSNENNIVYSGNSMVVDPKGNIQDSMQDSHEGLLKAILSWDQLYQFRSDFPVLKDQDDFEIAI